MDTELQRKLQNMFKKLDILSKICTTIIIVGLILDLHQNYTGSILLIFLSPMIYKIYYGLFLQKCCDKKKIKTYLKEAKEETIQEWWDIIIAIIVVGTVFTRFKETIIILFVVITIMGAYIYPIKLKRILEKNFK